METINSLAFAQAVIAAPLALANAAYLSRLREQLSQNGLCQAVASSDTAAIFDWLVSIFELQGISDRSAVAFSGQHGRPRWVDLERGLGRISGCPKLPSYWHFSECGHRKGDDRCSEPSHRPSCLVPRLPLRNGRLSQGAVSLFLFMRDVCDGDIIGWVDCRLAMADRPDAKPVERARLLRAALLDPMRNIFGVSDKVLGLALADLLLGGDPEREHWVVAGAGMIAIDSLCHNFFHRTGILRQLGMEHPYGPACYRADGCTGLIEGLAADIDARAFDPDYPTYFPRWVQSAVWEFCAADRLDICNGNKIDDKLGCTSTVCPVGNACERMPLFELSKRTKIEQSLTL